MKIGILREEKVPADERTPLTPLQCQRLIKLYPDIEIFVKSSPFRCFSDQEYRDLGLNIVSDLSFCDILLGIKEVPKDNLIPDKTYLYFSHTIKKQKYNRSLLQQMVKRNIRMIDYEAIKDDNDKRLLGFGRYAGIVGAYNGLRTYGLKKNCYSLLPAYKCEDKEDLYYQLNYLKLDSLKIVVTGSGRVARGILELLEAAGIKQVNVKDFLDSRQYDYPVFVQLGSLDYNCRKDGNLSSKSDFYENPHDYKSTFMQYAQVSDIFIAGHYYNSGAPYLFTREDAKSELFNLTVVADVSCDINGPVASTIRPSTIHDPIYGYNPITEQEDNFNKEGVLAVMAVDNLPCELPKDSSKDFGEELINNVFPLLVSKNQSTLISRATICDKGKLTSYFSYLKDYLRGD